MTPNNAEKERIANAEIVYVVAPSGCGKSFTGDALAYLHGYEHVDGDYPLKHAAVSARNKELAYGFLKSFHTCLGNEEESDDVWTPFYEEIATLTLQAAKTSSKVVLSHASYRQAYRECVVNKLIEGGAKRENIKVLELRIDPDVKLTGLYYRTKAQVENSGITMEDAFKLQGWDGDGPFTVDDYKIYIKNKNPDYAGNAAMKDIPEGYGAIVDVSSRDMTCIDRIEMALGLDAKDRNVEYQKFLSYDELRDKLQEVDQARDKEYTDNGSQVMFGEMWSEITGNKTVLTASADLDGDDDGEEEKENKKELMGRRRSSIASVEFLSSELGRTSLASSNNDDGDTTTVRKMKARRSSLITTGKIIE